MSASCDFLVIGAGPAGMAAAATAARHGVSTLLVDEQAAPGGQIYRAVERRDEHVSSVSHADWKRGAQLVEVFRASGAGYQPHTQVWQMDKDRNVYVTDGTKASCIKVRRVLIAAGAMERPLPIAGWTLPGVMTVGAAQILYKTNGYVNLGGDRVWLAGSGPLLWLFAAQALDAGARFEGLLDTTPAGNYARALRHAVGAVRNLATLRRGRALQQRVCAAGVAIVKNVSALEAAGDGQLVSVRYRVNGQWFDKPASQLLLHLGVVPNSHATSSLDVAQRWDDTQRCFAPVVDAWGNTSAEGYAAAGDCAGIVGAEAGALQGQLAALEAAYAIGAITETQRNTDAMPLRVALARHLPIRPFLDTLFAPRASLLVPADDVLVCRCESVTARQIRNAVALGCLGPNQMKAFTRCGMGPCQGRMCGLAAAEIIAQARDVNVGEVGVFNVRPPLKPLSMGELAALSE
jgi:NADPH-dependent 2,4-dienoyl-CoA reductase/sulfur reductase-like enzyme